MTDIVTYCDINTCEDCPRYGDDCDGDKRVEHTDYISRADAIEAVKKEIQDFETNYMHGEDDEEYGHDIGFVAGLHRAKAFIRSLPSAD